MASENTCPDCGSSNLVDDSLYSQSQLVCADCGSVVSEGLLTTNRSEEVQGTDVRYCETTAVDKQPCRNQIQGLKRVRALCRILRFPQFIEETAETLFKQAYEHPSFLKVSLKKKEVLAGCCVLLSSRLHNWPITMGTVYSLLEASEHVMGVVYTDLIKALKVEPPTNSIMDLVESHCHEYKLSPSQVPEEFSESTARLVERTSGLVELAADSWLVTGRHPVYVLVGAVYLAWLSLNPCKARLAVPLARFCRMAKVGMPRRAALRVTELKEVLCRLGKELPWLRGAPVEPRTVPTLAADILKHRVLLMRRAMRTFESQRPPAETSTCPDPAAEPSASADPVAETMPTSSQTVLEEGAEPCNGFGKSPCAAARKQSHWPSDDTGCKRQHVRTPPSGEASPNRETTPSDLSSNAASGDPEPESNWAKRHLFVPPCARNPPKRRRVEVLGPEVTGYEEISDLEIEGYLRTPQEVEELVKAQRGVMSAD
ncbi:hypothetical protein GJAV_G00038020 [Gymnothorax javanicus]|nr:hypothetical protein GJAV_G00038020 [Gymnothorax javanicus]